MTSEVVDKGRRNRRISLTYHDLAMKPPPFPDAADAGAFASNNVIVVADFWDAGRFFAI